MIDVALVLGVIREGFVAAQKLFEFLVTPAGQEIVKASIKDKAKFDDVMEGFGRQITGGWNEFWGKLRDPQRSAQGDPFVGVKA